MNKREFMMQYVLNRAKGHAGGMNVKGVALDAQRAWEFIETVAPKPQPRNGGIKDASE